MRQMMAAGASWLVVLAAITSLNAADSPYAQAVKSLEPTYYDQGLRMVAAVPEPSSITLIFAGLIAIVGWRRARVCDVS